MFDKITSRIQKLCYGLNADFVDPVSALFSAGPFSAPHVYFPGEKNRVIE